MRSRCGGSTCPCWSGSTTQPGVVSAAVTNAVPLAGRAAGQTRFRDRRHDLHDDRRERPTADMRVASPQYFDTLDIPLMRGRSFTELDHENSRGGRSHQRVDDAAVRRVASRSGRRSRSTAARTGSTVVGVVATSRPSASTRTRSRRSTCRCGRPAGLPDACSCGMTGDPATATTVIRNAVHGVDPRLCRSRTCARWTRSATRRWPRRELTAMLLTVFAALWRCWSR